MRRSVRVVVALAVVAACVAVPSAANAGPGAPAITADRAAVLDPLADTLLYDEQGSPAAAAMASTAKIMTIYVTLNAVKDGHTAMTEHIEFSENAASTACNCFNDVAGTIQPGDEMTVEDALFAVALSDGEPTVAVAEHVAFAVLGPTPEVIADAEAAFVDCMNFAASELGLTDTHFETPHGGDHPDQVTSAADLARLWAVASAEHPEFLEILGWWTRDLRVFHGGAVYGTPYTWSNSHGYYPGVEGSKGGNSGLCPQCWVASAERLGRRLVVSDMQSDNNVSDAAELFRWGFDELFRPQRVGDSGNIDTIEHHALDCSGSHVFSAARDDGGLLTLNRFDADADAGTVGHVGGITTAVGIQEVDIARVSSWVVATLHREASGRLQLRTWRWAGASPVLIDTESLSDGSTVRVVRLDDNRLLTAWRTATGVRLTTWAVSEDGLLTVLDTHDAAGAVTELDVATDLSGTVAMVALRRAAKLVLQSYSTAGGVIGFLDEELRGAADQIRVTYVGTGWTNELATPTTRGGKPGESYDVRWATSFVNSSDRLGVSFWRTNPDDGILLAGTWGDVGLPAAQTAITAAHGTGAVAAYQDDKGRLRLDVADFDWAHTGPATWSFYRMAESPAAAAGKATHIEVCEVPTSTAALAQLTAVRTDTGQLKLILWREADSP